MKKVDLVIFQLFIIALLFSPVLADEKTTEKIDTLKSGDSEFYTVYSSGCEGKVLAAEQTIDMGSVLISYGRDNNGICNVIFEFAGFKSCIVSFPEKSSVRIPRYILKCQENGDLEIWTNY